MSWCFRSIWFFAVFLTGGWAYRFSLCVCMFASVWRVCGEWCVTANGNVYACSWFFIFRNSRADVSVTLQKSKESSSIHRVELNVEYTNSNQISLHRVLWFHSFPVINAATLSRTQICGLPMWSYHPVERVLYAALVCISTSDLSIQFLLRWFTVRIAFGSSYMYAWIRFLF